MVKFNLKKKIAKALVFAMVMGTVGVHGLSLKSPVAVMAADATAVTFQGGIVCPGGSLTLEANPNGDYTKLEYTVKTAEYAYTDNNQQKKEDFKSSVEIKDGNILTVKADVKKGTAIVVEAKATVSGQTQPSVVNATFTVADSATYGYAGVPSLNIDTSVLEGNYIYVAYYTDAEGKKLKSTFLYTKDELGSTTTISLGALNLKKGGSFRVYDEIRGIDNVNLIEVAPQKAKLKVKVSDLTKDNLLEAIQITVDGKDIKDNIKDYYGNLTIDGNPVIIQNRKNGVPEVDKDGNPIVVVDNKLLDTIKLAARAGGQTFIVKYHSGNEVPVEAKFKVSAAAKAPSVTIDYVNGTYTIKKGTYYTIANVNANGTIKSPDATLAAATDKVVLTTQDVIEKAPVIYDQATTYVEGTKYYEAKYKYEKATGVTSDTYTNYYVLTNGNYVKAVASTPFDEDGDYYEEKLESYVEKSTGVTSQNVTSYYVERVQTAAAIILQSPAKGAKMASLMAVYKVEKLKDLTIDVAKDYKTATLKLGEDKVAELTFTETGVKVKALAANGISYSTKDLKKPATLKQNAETKKEVALGKDDVITIKVLGKKASKTEAAIFGSGEIEVKNELLNAPVKPDPVDVYVEAKSLAAFESGTVYYTEASGTYTRVTDTSGRPVSGTKYFTKETYTVAETFDSTKASDYYTKNSDGEFVKVTAAVTADDFDKNVYSYYTMEAGK